MSIWIEWGEYDNGNISYTLKDDQQANPSLSDKANLGESCRRYTWKTGGTVTYVPGATVTAQYGYQSGYVARGANTGWGRLWSGKTGENPGETAEECARRKAAEYRNYSGYAHDLIEYYAEPNNDMGAGTWQVCYWNFTLKYEWGEEQTGTVTGTIPSGLEPPPQIKAIWAVYPSTTYCMFTIWSVSPSGADVKIAIDDVGNKTVSGTGSVTFYNLSSDTVYTYSVYINGTLYSSGDSFTTQRINTPELSDIFFDQSDKKLHIVIDDTVTIDTATVYINEQKVGTYSCSDGTTTILCNAPLNKTIEVRIDCHYTFLATINTYVRGGFDWDSTILQGAEIPHVGTTIMPVTAEEWNRLVGFVNAFLNTKFGTVSAGDVMDVSPGENVGMIADALHVPIPAEKKITAAFFIALKDAVNAL